MLRDGDRTGGGRLAEGDLRKNESCATIDRDPRLVSEVLAWEI